MTMTINELKLKDYKVYKSKNNPYMFMAEKDGVKSYYEYESIGKDIEDSINWDNAQIQEKIDGIIQKTACVKINNEKRLYFFTNGSFDLNAPFEDSMVFDEPATRGAEMYGDLLEYALKKTDNSINIHFNRDSGEFYATGGWTELIPLGSTLMLELTSPRNRIICEYKETELWWHGYRDPNGIEHNPRELDIKLPLKTPILYNASNYNELKEILKTFNGKEQEGVVVVDYTTKDTPRVKIKCEDYLKQKFARDNSCNTQVLFKAVVDNEYDDLISSIPGVIPKINEIIENIKKAELWLIEESVKIPYFENKKDYVFWVKSNTKKSLFSYYMDMGALVLDKFEKKLKNLSVKKHGYEELLKMLEEINENK